MDDTQEGVDLFSLADDLGPSKIIHLTDPDLGLRAVVAIDNVSIGPAIGGVRMSPEATAIEAFRLARAMTLKNAAAGLSHGGGKAVIIADPAQPPEAREMLIRAFAEGIRDLKEYIPGPDMGTDETAMGWIRDQIGRAVGLPRALGGIPLDQIGATGWGLVGAIEVALAHMDLPLEGARVAVQGFGAVGGHAARFLFERGARIVAVADAAGTLHAPGGLDIPALLKLRDEGRPIQAWADGEHLPREDVVGVPCEIWIPAARPDVVTLDNVDRLDTRLVVQGANIPFTPEAEALLHERGVLVLPDFIANAGGVICAAVEYRGGGEEEAFEIIAAKVRANTAHVLERVQAEGVTPRQAATELALERVHKAMEFGPFRATARLLRRAVGE